MKKLMTVLAAAFTAAVILPIQAAGTSSLPTMVYLNPDESYIWRTAPSATFLLQWADPSGVGATLEVTGKGYSKTYEDLTEGSLQLSLPTASSEADENVFDFVLTLGDGTVKTAKLGSVRGGVGAGGTALLTTYRDANSKRWPKYKGKAVIPVPYGTETMTVDGKKVETGLEGAAGWYLLVPDEAGTTSTLALDGEEVIVRDNSLGLFIVVQ